MRALREIGGSRHEEPVPGDHEPESGLSNVDGLTRPTAAMAKHHALEQAASLTPGQDAGATRRSHAATRLLLHIFWMVMAVPFAATAADFGIAPRAALISVAPASVPDDVLVTGAAGSVTGGATVVIVNLDTGYFATARASAAGSFSASVWGPPGSTLLVKSEPNGFRVAQFLGEMENNFVPGNHTQITPLPGTMIRIPETASEGPGIPFTGAGLTMNGDPPLPVWTLRGTIDRATAQPGQTVVIAATLTLNSSTGTPATVRATLQRFAGGNGDPSMADNEFMSVFMTPTNLPIERQARAWNEPLDVQVSLTPVAVAANRFQVPFEIRITIPADLPHGHYRPRLYVTLDGAASESATRPLATLSEFKRTAYLPIIRIGNPAPPRLHAALLMNETTGGVQGIRAREDAQRFGISSRVVTGPDAAILERVDSRSGTPIAYSLEPYFPMVSHGVRRVPSIPLVPFRFPSGSLTARVRRPDGTVETIGPAPFVQDRVVTPSTVSGELRDQGPHMTDPYQLTTLDPRFTVQFPVDGRYQVSLEGAVDDIWGNRWSFAGTYELRVGRRLVIDAAVIPGTPFEEGDALVLGGRVQPPLPAEMEVRVRHAVASDSSRMADLVFRGRANRFGQIQLPEFFRFTSAGEYRVDVDASYAAADGTQWFGTRTWGGVVAPRASPIVAHGRRGIEKQETGFAAWFFRRDTGLPIPGPSHMFFPFLGGDVTWNERDDSTFLAITIDDPSERAETLLRDRALDSSKRFVQVPLGQGTLDERIQVGETPLFSSRPEPMDPHLDPSRVDLWAYNYATVQRPQVSVREEVTEDQAGGHYWLFKGSYLQQPGVGANGDLPNDFKFMFGAAVLRGPAIGDPLYAIYGSLFVLVPEGNPGGGSRTFPPFQGNGGGPDGGPLFALKGKEIDLFFHPTAVRPVTILHRGERVSLAGYSAPTLPSKIEVLVTSPSGVTRTIRGHANRIGYFYDPGQDFAVGETGVWKAKVKIVFDGRTSAGQVTALFPTGDLLGSREGEFWFYVVDSTTPPLAITASSSRFTTSPAGVRFVRPADAPVTFTIAPPPGLTNVELHITTTMPGFILEETRLQPPTASSQPLTYIYDAQKLAKDFPNLDLHDSDGFAGVDTITISFLLSGTNGNGDRRHFARQIVIQGEELQMPEQKETIVIPRRRSVRK